MFLVIFGCSTLLNTVKKCRIEKQKWNLKENKFSIAFNLYYFCPVNY